MLDDLNGNQAGGSVNQAEIKPESGILRGQKACQACRIAKVKCIYREVVETEPPETCTRCRSAAIQCVFPPSRRGRVKGSKNKKTLEKMAEKGISPSWSDRKPSSQEPWNGFGWSGSTPSFSQEDNKPFTFEPSENGPPSPFDPFLTRPGSPEDPDQARPSKKSRLSRDTLAQLEKTFPTGSEKEVEPPLCNYLSSSQKDLHNPLLFLAECARRGWDANPQRTEPLAIPKTCYKAPMGGPADQRVFFQHGLFGTKRDVSAGLDAVQRGVINEEQVADLFGCYFRTVHPGLPLLDETLHTPSFVRSRSAYLFTTILAMGATSIATLPGATREQSSRALKLHAHVEKLQLVLCATAAKSIEIIQAEVSLPLRKPRLVDDQRWPRLGMCGRMASTIGLYRQTEHKSENLDPPAMNEFRLRVALILLESRWESIADRKPTSPNLRELTDSEFDKLNDTHPHSQDALLAADYALHRFELDSKVRLEQITQTGRNATSLESEKIWIKTYIQEWEQTWVHPQTDQLRRWHFQYTSHRSLLVGLLRIAKRQSSTGQWTTSMRHDVLQVSIRMLEDALRHDRALHMIRPTSPLVFACTMVLQLSEQDHPARDLILRIALRCAGNPKGDVVTYAKHNGFQILNMLCLSKGTGVQRQAASSQVKEALAEMQPPPARTIPSVPEVPASDPYGITGNGWTDLDQLLGYSGNVEFPYFAGEMLGGQVGTVAASQPDTQWNDLFASLSSSTAWNTANFAAGTCETGNNVDWDGSMMRTSGQMSDNHV